MYCYTPARWLYERNDYLGATPSRAYRTALKMLGPSLERWDRKAAATAAEYLAISSVSQARVKRVYGIDADIVYPPHVMNPDYPRRPAALPDAWGGAPRYMLTVSRLLPYKNVDRVIEACRIEKARLVIVGTGPERERLRSIAGPEVLFLEGIDDDQLRWLYANAEALVAASFEDFGLTPVEAASFGVPSVTLSAGGYLDTVVPGRTGIFFSSPEPPHIAEALRKVRAANWRRVHIQAHAARFSEERYICEMRDRVERLHHASAG